MSMKNLGDKLQATRESMGYSLRDVAEATHLRADVIENMESGKFDYPLAEIYRRGFLRIYAAFLRLDVNAIMAEYTAGAHIAEPKKARHIMQRMAASPASATPEVAPVEDTAESADASSRFEDAAESPKSDDEQIKYIKLGAIFVALVLVVVVIILIVSSAVKTDVPEENPEINAQIPTQPASAANAVGGVISAANVEASKGDILLAISAIGDTYILVYPENEPTKPFFSGPIQAGERKEFKSAVPIIVKLTDAERIKLERNAKPLDIGAKKGLNWFKVGYPKQ